MDILIGEENRKVIEALLQLFLYLGAALGTGDRAARPSNPFKLILLAKPFPLPKPDRRRKV